MTVAPSWSGYAPEAQTLAFGGYFRSESQQPGSVLLKSKILGTIWASPVHMLDIQTFCPCLELTEITFLRLGPRNLHLTKPFKWYRCTDPELKSDRIWVSYFFKESERQVKYDLEQWCCNQVSSFSHIEIIVVFSSWLNKNIEMYGNTKLITASMVGDILKWYFLFRLILWCDWHSFMPIWPPLDTTPVFYFKRETGPLFILFGIRRLSILDVGEWRLMNVSLLITICITSGCKG